MGRTDPVRRLGRPRSRQPRRRRGPLGGPAARGADGRGRRRRPGRRPAGESPAEAAASAGKAAVAALAEPAATARTVHLSFGDFTAEEYAWQVLADHVVHTWDLAVAIGAQRELEPRLVEVTTGWWEAWEDAYRGAGAVGPAVALPDVRVTAGPAGGVVRPGPDAGPPVHDVVRRFGAAWEAWDLDAIMALMADDAVFESTGPAPDGRAGRGSRRDPRGVVGDVPRDAGRRRSPSRRRSSPVTGPPPAGGSPGRTTTARRAMSAAPT